MRMHGFVVIFVVVVARPIFRWLYLCARCVSVYWYVHPDCIGRQIYILVAVKTPNGHFTYNLPPHSHPHLINPLWIAVLCTHTMGETPCGKRHIPSIHRETGRYMIRNAHTLTNIVLGWIETALSLIVLMREKESGKKHCINGSSINRNSNSDGMITAHVVCEFTRSQRWFALHIHIYSNNKTTSSSNSNSKEKIRRIAYTI